MSDVVERLQLHKTWRDSHGELNDAPNQALDTIKRFQAALEMIEAGHGCPSALARDALEKVRGEA